MRTKHQPCAKKTASSHWKFGLTLGLVLWLSIGLGNHVKAQTQVATTDATACQKAALAVQVLGSGGPEFDPKRASSGYLIWRDGKAWALVDTGSGSRLRFAQSGANFNDVQYIFFTHLHVDHSADFAAYVKSSFFTDRTTPLVVYGPSGSDLFPKTKTFVERELGHDTGAYPYLSRYIEGHEEAAYHIETHDINADDKHVREVLTRDGVEVLVTGVEHGILPALAWRFDADGHSVTFSGDTSGANGWLQKLAHNTDLLIAHHAITWRHRGVYRLHMPPEVIGQVAAAAGVKDLVLSHRMLRTQGDEERTLQDIRKNYAGPIQWAEDLSCYVVAP